MNDYQAKIRTIGVSLRRGTSEKRRVTDERDGSLAGHQVEHWDDHLDAYPRAKTIRVKAPRLEEER